MIGVHDLLEQGLHFFFGARVAAGFDVLAERIQLRLIFGNIAGHFVGPSGQVLEEQQELLRLHAHRIQRGNNGPSANPCPQKETDDQQAGSDPDSHQEYWCGRIHIDF